MTHVTYLSDCSDDNADGRLQIKTSTYLGASMKLVPIKHTAAAGMDLVDMLNACRVVSSIKPYGRQIILANMARREKSQGVYRNGPPFCYFKVGSGSSEVLVVSTFTEGLLSLAHRLDIVSEVNLLDIPEVLRVATKKGVLTEDEIEEIEYSQFRSLDFVPLVTRLLMQAPFRLPSEVRHLGNPPPASGIALRIDNFGNIFTDVLPEDVGFEAGGKMALFTGDQIKCYSYLADVPKGELAAVIGSSGYGRQKFIMVTVQGKKASKRLLIHEPGDAVIDCSPS